MEQEVIPVQSFDHGGTRRRGEAFFVSRKVAEQLRRNGLVVFGREADPSVPSPAAGKPSSASPAAPASRRQTARRFAPGANVGQGEASS